MVYDGTERRSGQISNFGIRAEDTYATRESGNTLFDPRGSECYFEEIPNQTDEGGIRDSRASLGHLDVYDYVEAVARGELVNGAIMVLAMGKVSTTGSDPYTHTVKPIRMTTGETDIYAQSYTLEGRYKKPDGSTDDDITLLGAVCRTFTETIPLTGDRKITYNLDLIGKALGSTSAALSEDTDATMHSGITTVEIDDNATSFSSGDQVYGLNNFTWTLNHNYPSPENFAEFGSLTMDRQPYPGTLRNAITGALTRKYIDTDLLTLTEPFSMRVKSTRGANDYVQRDFNNCVFLRKRKGQWNRDEPIENLPVPFKAAEVTVEVKDSTATYV